MGGLPFWVEIWHKDSRLGAGFFVTRRYVLTARHCVLRVIQSADPMVEVRCAGAVDAPIPARLYQQQVDADMALVEIIERPAVPVALPSADLCRTDDLWRNPYRPLDSDPFLSGTVQAGPVPYRCAEGGMVSALQLQCDQALGDYSGYSGSPVQRVDGQDAAVLGILTEQYLDRHDGQRATDVLFAATMKDALSRFDCFDVGHLWKVLSVPDTGGPVNSPAMTSAASGIPVPHTPRSAVQDMVADATALAELAQGLVSSELLDPDNAKTQLRRIFNRIADDGFPESPP
jgi:hypothetical protein